ncbi:hypothetical protein GCM10023187_53110 [Nibrella viscosa]|uniref:Signal transduction histidine kinase internal region domain-containing protein n=1 Tax=Nibrella viscosa TaxID=1084524 RepID=A0ABP8KZ62_9BACT
MDGTSKAQKGTNLDQNHFFLFLTSPAWTYRVARYALLWSTTLWLIYRGFDYISGPVSDPKARQQYIILSTLFFGSLTIGAYLLVTLLTRQFILRQFRMGMFVLCLLGVHVLTSLVVHWHFLFFLRYLGPANLPNIYSRNAEHVASLAIWQIPFDTITVFLFSYSLFYNYLLYAVGFKVFKDLFSLKIRQERLEKENLLLEFNFLKAQINPHFLFNTLNNIYSFAIKSPDKVPDTVLKLADLMRYSLYETETELVPLAKEIQFLDSYIELQRIRYDASFNLSYTVQGNPGQLMVPPLLLIVFVENAFKHGLQANPKAGWASIGLTIKKNSLVFSVENSRPIKKINGVGGIGLVNVRKRLDHFYDRDYELQIEEQPQSFRIHLTLILHEPALSSHHR